MLVKRLVTVIGLALVVAACGGDGDSPEPLPPDTVTVTAAPTSASDAESTTAPGGAHGSGCTPSSETTLPDGRWYGLVASASEAEIEFDLACWFTGEAAASAAEEAGEESPPPNDYFVRNNNELTRTLAVADGTEVVFYVSGDPDSQVQGDVAAWRGILEDRGATFGVWIETSEGEVVAIEEQWVP